MKRSAIGFLALLALTLPRLAQAQFTVDNEYGPPPYNDVEDGQALRIAGYILAPFGYALEWGLTRPLHYAATDTALAPVLSGDTDIKYFGETSNAARLQPSTFAPFTMPANPNAIDPSPDPAAGAYSYRSNVLPPVSSRSKSYQAPAYLPGGQQPALH